MDANHASYKKYSLKRVYQQDQPYHMKKDQYSSWELSYGLRVTGQDLDTNLHISPYHTEQQTKSRHPKASNRLQQKSAEIIFLIRKKVIY